MKRSRLTFATTEAAAIAALVASPPTTGRCSKPVGGTAKPSERQRLPWQATPVRTSRSGAEARAEAPVVAEEPRAGRPRAPLGAPRCAAGAGRRGGLVGRDRRCGHA